MLDAFETEAGAGSAAQQDERSGIEIFDRPGPASVLVLVLVLAQSICVLLSCDGRRLPTPLELRPWIRIAALSSHSRPKMVSAHGGAWLRATSSTYIYWWIRQPVARAITRREPHGPFA